jgi:hypothetical protein
MGDFFEGLSSFLPVAPGTFGEKPPEKRDENGQQPNSVPQQKQGRGGLDCTNGGLWDNMGDQKTLAERINAGAKFNKQDRDKQTELIAGGKGAIGDMNEAEPPKEPDPPMPEAPPKSTMTKPLAPIEAGVEECDLCGRWKSKCRICAALFCEQCSMGEAIRLSHVRRGTVICGQCTVTLDKVPSARIVPLSIPELTIGPSMKSDKAWKQQVLKGASKLPSRPPPAVSFIGLRTKQKEFSPEDLDNDFKYQNLFEVLFSPELHLLAAMFEVMPEDAECNRLLAAVLRLIDRSARTEVIIKACVEMEVANTLDATTMFRRSNMSLRILRMHLSKAHPCPRRAPPPRARPPPTPPPARGREGARGGAALTRARRAAGWRQASRGVAAVRDPAPQGRGCPPAPRLPAPPSCTPPAVGDAAGQV